jgi:hypothetical protein
MDRAFYLNGRPLLKPPPTEDEILEQRLKASNFSMHDILQVTQPPTVQLVSYLYNSRSTLRDCDHPTWLRTHCSNLCCSTFSAGMSRSSRLASPRNNYSTPSSRIPCLEHYAISCMKSITVRIAHNSHST